MEYYIVNILSLGHFEFALVEFTSFLSFIIVSLLSIKFRIKIQCCKQNKLIKPAKPRPLPYGDVFSDFFKILRSRTVTGKLPTLPYGVVPSTFVFLTTSLQTTVSNL